MNLLDFGKMRSKDLLRVIKPSGLIAAEEVDAVYTQRVNTETLGDAVFSLDLVGFQSFPSAMWPFAGCRLSRVDR